MNNNTFYRQLEKKVPYWQAQGWLDHRGAKEILHDTQASIQKSHKLSFILGIMGVLLLAAGAISFFAANWQGMSKLLKLSLLFSSMIGSYLISARFLYQQRHPALGQIFLLLGVLLFGNNIMLIAQIYHIDSHYPNGILLWAIGALTTAFIMRSETVLILAILLALLWSSMEIFDFRQIHWPWIIFWLLSLMLVIRQHFYIAAHVTILSLFLWLLFSSYSFSYYFSEGFFVQVYLLSGLFIFTLAGTIKSSNSKNFRHWKNFSNNLSRYALIFSLIFLYILSFPGLDLGNYQSKVFDEQLILGITTLTFIITIGVLFFVQRVVQRKYYESPLMLYQKAGILGLLVLFSTLLLNVFFYQQFETIPVIIINILILFLVVWLIVAGLAEHKQFYVNLAFLLFTISLFSRYFDTFWSLMNHSLFFILGGMLLIFGGYWLEKKRRQVSEQLASNAGSRSAAIAPGVNQQENEANV